MKTTSPVPFLAALLLTFSAASAASCGGGGDAGGTTSGGGHGGSESTATATGTGTSGTGTATGTGAGGNVACPGGCDDKDPCTADSCDPATGMCDHVPIVYFKEAFDSNAAGWQLDTGWQIGAAVLSSGQALGFGTDPANDHTGDKAGGGIAGVYIGDNVPNALAADSYLTSPTVDLSKVTGTVVLEFYRILNADVPPYMTSTVDVFDGSAWVPVFPAMPQQAAVQENTVAGKTTWTKEQYDVTAQAAGKAGFKVRWGYSVGQIGVQKVGSWNVDDVRLLPATTCM
jgi:Dictyostelium (slime mold) repeat